MLVKRVEGDTHHFRYIAMKGFVREQRLMAMERDERVREVDGQTVDYNESEGCVTRLDRACRNSEIPFSGPRGATGKRPE
jgi:hypothetical protein